MRTLAVGAVVAGAWLVLGSGPLATSPSPANDPVGPAPAVAARATPSSAHELAPATLTEVVRQYCVVCHNDQMMTGNVSFQSLDVERAAEQPAVAERMIRKLRAGMMPPPGAPRPSPDTLLALVETLERKVDEAAKSAPNLGERRFTRITTAEYERIVEDLLDLEVDARRWLPTDVKVGVFDNTAAGQALSTTILDSFLRAAGEVSRMALGEPDAASVSTKYVNAVEVSQHAWDHVEGAPFGTRGGIVVTHTFPVDGEYVFQIEKALGVGNQTSMEDIDVSIDGKNVALLMLPHGGAGGRQGGGFGGGGGEGGGGGIRTEPIFVTAGQHQVSAAFVNLIEGPYEDRLQPTAWSWAGTQGNDYGITGLAHLTELIVTGPVKKVAVSETASRRKVFVCRPASAAEERPCAESIIKNLASKAYRRPITAEETTDLLALYDEMAASEGFEVGIRTALQGILAAPQFIFRFELQPADVQPGEAYPLSGMDLATRLSFFLWAAAPDQELLQLAQSGRLSDRRVLQQQVERLLKDPRSESLSTRFLHQWLRLEDVGKVWPEPTLFPDFSTQLRDAMVQESEMLFQHLVNEDRSLLELFSADYSFLNERLARHYGIDGISGDEMRLVKYPADSPRRGIFAHGSVLQLTSMSDRTSPVQRGKWVMEVLMGTPPPPPPPNVPAFEASPPAAEGRRLTTRERMERHRTAPVCSSCHRFIDPIGLSLDNFDAVGKWRIRENMQALDTRGQFYDGTPVSTPTELSAVLLKRPVPLVRNFMNRLMSYAIGRPTEFYDQPTIREITKAAEADGYKLSSLIMGIVMSDPFLMRQAQSTTSEGAE
jgi:hypothetical protein